MVESSDIDEHWDITARTIRIGGPREDYYSLDTSFPRSWIASRELNWMRNDYTAVHYATTIPGRYAPILRWMDQAYSDLRALSRVTRRRSRQTRLLGQWYMACRALSGLCLYIAEFGGSDVYPDDLSRRQRTERELTQRATRLGEAVQRYKEGFVDPVRTYSPQTIERQDELADRLWQKLNDGDIPPMMRDLATNSSVGIHQRELIGGLYAMIFADGVSEIAHTSRHQQIVDACDRARSAADDRIRGILQQHPELRSRQRDERVRALNDLDLEGSNGLETAATVGALVSGIAGNSTGNMPLGSDSATMSYARLVVAWQIVREGSVTREWLDQRFRSYVRATGNADQAAQQALSRAATQSDNELNVNQAHDALSEHFQTGAGFNIAVTTLAIFQVGFLVAAHRAGPEPPSDRDVFDEAVAVAQAGAAVVYTIARAGERRAVPVALEGMMFTVQGLRRVISRVDTAGSSLLALLAISDGCTMWAEGEATQNMVTQTVGAITAGSGACIALATLGSAFEMAGAASVLGPIGVALGLVAGIISVVVAVRDATRPLTVRVFEQLVSTIGNSDAHDHQHEHLVAMSHAFDDLLSWMRDHYSSYVRHPDIDDLPNASLSDFGYHEVDYSFAHQGSPADQRRVRAGLFALGFDTEAVNRLCPQDRF